MRSAGQISVISASVLFAKEKKTISARICNCAKLLDADEIKIRLSVGGTGRSQARADVDPIIPVGPTPPPRAARREVWQAVSGSLAPKIPFMSSSPLPKFTRDSMIQTAPQSMTCGPSCAISRYFGRALYTTPVQKRNERIFSSSSARLLQSFSLHSLICTTTGPPASPRRRRLRPLEAPSPLV